MSGRDPTPVGSDGKAQHRKWTATISAADLSDLREQALYTEQCLLINCGITRGNSPCEEADYIAAGPDAYIAAEALSRQFALATTEELAQDQNSRPTWCRLLREIFGNPFRPTTHNSFWLTSTVLALAQVIYYEEDFSLMPILADALEDVHCNDEDILNHCRQPGEHYKGCWVIDEILANQ